MLPGDVAAAQQNALVLARATEILAQVGEELAFVEAGKDTGLLPINSLVMDFEELPHESAPAPFRDGLAAARALLDHILDGSGIFTNESIQFLNHWHSWMSAVLAAWERGSEMPPALENWSSSSGSVVTTSESTPAPGPPQPTVPQPGADEPAIHLNLAEDTELLREFHSESLELLQAIEQGGAAT